jgi:hypothetical protein
MAYQKHRGANSATLALARSLGWFSIGLGLAEVLAPRSLTKPLGMEGKEGLLRFYGMREMAAGLGILISGNPRPWIWGRVAGDGVDLATLATGLDQHNLHKANVAMTLAAVAGVTALDGLCARALRGTAGTVRDYSDRRGMPKPPEAMRGAARNLHIPKDMRTPEALRPFTAQPTSERSSVEHSRA